MKLAILLAALVLSPVAMAGDWAGQWKTWYNSHNVRKMSSVLDCKTGRFPSAKDPKVIVLIHLCDLQIGRSCYRAIVTNDFKLMMPMLHLPCHPSLNPFPIQHV